MLMKKGCLFMESIYLIFWLGIRFYTFCLSNMNISKHHSNEAKGTSIDYNDDYD